MTMIPLPETSELKPFAPEIILVATTVVALLVPVFSPKKNVLAVAAVSVLGVFAALVSLFFVWPAAPATYFGDFLTMDPFSWLFKLAVLVFVLIVLALWLTHAKDEFEQHGHAGDTPEYFTLMLCATVGMCLMGSTSHLLMIFLAIEMASLPSYVLAGFRKTHKLGAEAAMKYVLFGAASAAVMVYGMSLLYGLFGTLDLADMNVRLLTGTDQIVFAMGIIGLLVGIGFKIAMFPVHFWCPDVFEGAAIDVTAFLSVASKAAGLALLTRVVTLVAQHGGGVPLEWLPIALLVLGAVTCTWGNLGAYPQTNIKRLLAFSSIGHAGYMILGLCAFVTAKPAAESIGAADAMLFYLLMYVLMNGAAFVAAAAIAQRIAAPGRDGEDITNYAGLGRRAPLLALAMLISCLSLVGIPLTVGFATKLKLVIVLFNANHWVAFAAIAALGINTVIGAFIYFRIIRQMYLAESEEPRVIELAPITAVALLLAALNIGVFLFYSPVDHQTARHAVLNTAMLKNPDQTP